MGTFIAKVKREPNWRLMLDNVTESPYDGIVFDDAIPYDPDVQEGTQLFKIEHFNQGEYTMPILERNFNAAEYRALREDEYIRSLSYIAYYNDGKYFFQGISKSSYVKKKTLFWGDRMVNYKCDNNFILLNPFPNCIYDKDRDTLFFKEIGKANTIFPHIKVNYYQAATNEQVELFLQDDMINVTEGFAAGSVGVQNRKRISAVKEKLRRYQPQQRDVLKRYISGYTRGRLRYENGQFAISNDDELRLLLYGIQQRLYTEPLSNEDKVAVSTTPIANLLPELPAAEDDGE